LHTYLRPHAPAKCIDRRARASRPLTLRALTRFRREVRAKFPTYVRNSIAADHPPLLRRRVLSRDLARPSERIDDRASSLGHLAEIADDYSPPPPPLSRIANERLDGYAGRRKEESAGGLPRSNTRVSKELHVKIERRTACTCYSASLLSSDYSCPSRGSFSLKNPPPREPADRKIPAGIFTRPRPAPESRENRGPRNGRSRNR